MATETENDYISNCNSDQTCIDSYQGMTAGTYYLKGKKTYEYVNNSWQCISEFDDGNGNCSDPEYNTNKATLLSAFGSSNCTDNSQEFRCHAGILHAYADSNGYVYFFDSSWGCRIDEYGVADCWDGG